MTWIICALTAYAFIFIFVISLCKAAARGDRVREEAFADRPNATEYVTIT